MPLVANGTIDGKITVADTVGFKVKQQVILLNSANDRARLEVKRVESSTVMYVGPVGGKITDRSDISLFTTATTSTVEAPEQPRPSIPEQEIERLTYEEEPTVARRVILVDEYGDPHTNANPVPVDVSVTIGSVDVDLDAESGDDVALGAHPVQIRSKAADTITTSGFEEIFTYTSTSNNTRISYVEVTVSTPSIVRILVDGDVIRELRTSPLDRNALFPFGEPYKLLVGKVISVEAQVDRFLHASFDTFTSLEGYLH